MKTKTFAFVIIAAIILNAQNASAKILRVGYFGTAITGQDFADFQTAHNAATIGDTLLIFPGSYNGTISKRLVLIGYGYLVTGTGANADLQSTTGALSFGNLNLAAGCDNSTIEGLDALVISPNNNVTLIGVLINRCNVTFSIGYNTTTISNFKITQSILAITSNFGYLSTFQNLMLQNNIINSSNFAYTTASNCTGVFNNNIFTTTPNLNNGGYTLSNNIFLGTTAPSNVTGCIFMNNIATNNTIPAGNGNQPNVNLSSVFVGYPTQGSYSYDSRYVLSSSSPAIGTGTDGGNLGIFGGANPYRLSGIPAIPSFYKISAASPIANGANPYNITFSVRSNN